MRYLVLIFFSTLLSFALIANEEIENLKNSLKQTDPSGKCETYISLINIYKRSNPDSAIYYAQLVQKNCSLNNDTLLAMSYKLKGVAYFFSGKYNATLTSFSKSLKLYILINDSANIGGMYNNIGRIHAVQNNYPLAIDYHLKALRILDQLKGVEAKLAGTYINLGNIHYSGKHYNKAIDSYKKAIKYCEKVGDNKRKLKALGNIAVSYKEKRDYRNAKKYARLIFEISDLSKERTSTYITALSTFGDILYKEKHYKLALTYLDSALYYQEKNKDYGGIISSKTTLGDLYLKSRNLPIALNYCQEANQLANTISSPLKKQLACECLSEVYEAMGEKGKALAYYKQFVQLKDSIFNEDKATEIAQKSLQFDFDKKEQLTQQKHDKEQLIKEQDAKRSKLTALFIGFCLLLAVIFGVIINKRLILTKKQKKLISQQKAQADIQNIELEKQKTKAEINKKLAEIQTRMAERQMDKAIKLKQEVVHKSKEISDSINYAQRLQQAILPARKEMRISLRNSFVLFQPKDVVSGDFYWMEKKEDMVYYAAADCTGHGVPGALVSVVCSNALERAVKEFNLTNTGEILDKVADLVIARFEKSGEEVKDGMDISLCAINIDKQQVQYSGANNPLWIIRKRKGDEEFGLKDIFDDNYYFIEYRASRQPVGKYADRKPFEVADVDLQKGDNLYVFTDGFADQFGGAKGKKYMYKKFKKLLLSFSEIPMEEQHKMLQKEFADWKGSEEQIDDVCIIGVRV